MFSGIVETTTIVSAVARSGHCMRVEFQNPAGWRMRVGESVAVDGICSTIVLASKELFAVEYMPQTLKKTTASSLKKGTSVNLERSLVYGKRIHGHFTMGHVDARAMILTLSEHGRSRLMTIRMPRGLSKYVVARGSVAIHGVSLTIAKKTQGAFVVALIPHTLKVTNLGQLKSGDEVNVECDMLARYGLAGVRRR